MVELNMMEKLLTVLVQATLYLAFPWETSGRGDVILLLIVLGVCSVAIVGAAEWFIEHIIGIEIPG